MPPSTMALHVGYYITTPRFVTDLDHLERIGFGHCGSVWGTLGLVDGNNVIGCAGPNVVIKREDASPGRDIQNEVSVQEQIFACVTSGFLKQTLVPKCFGLVRNRDVKWKQLLPLLPPRFEGCRAMIAEKIDPVSMHAQLLLIDKYGPEKHREELRRSLCDIGKPEHCLVRLYLGRRRQMQHDGQRRGPRFFSLRNFPLHVDQAQELGLPCEEYAKAMAEALAILHWDVRTNGADVEFVLGAPRGARPPVTLRGCAIWMLDFDCSRPVTADEAGLESIARAFWRNDPYYPRPWSDDEGDQKLWDIFVDEYRRVGYKMVRRFPRRGEDADMLCRLVYRALLKVADTKGRWKSGVL